MPHILSKSFRSRIHVWSSKLKRILRVRHDQAPSEVFIHRLPPELLTEIFLYLTEDHPRFRSMHNWARNDGGPYASTQLILVCRYWRELALQAPILWTNIHLVEKENVGFVQRLVDRSAKAPLRVKSEKLRPIDSSTLKVVLREASRFKSADLNLMHIHDGDLSHIPHQSMLLLEDLSLQRADYHAGTLTTNSTPCPVPTFFQEGGSYPILRNLTLINFSVDPKSTLWSSTITSLHLCGPFNTRSPIPLSVAVAILSQLPNLISLLLANFERGSTTSPPEGPSTITFPYMESLNLGASVVACADMLRRLVLPANAEVKLSSVNGDTPTAEHDVLTLSRTVVPFLNGRNREGKMPKYRTCKLGVERSMCFLFYLWQEHWESLEGDGEGERIQDQSFLSSFQLIASRPTQSPDVSRMVASSPLQNVESLFLQSLSRIRLYWSSWATLVFGTPRVSLLHISNDEESTLDMVEIREMLGKQTSPTPVRHGSEDQAEVYPLQGLKELTLEDTWFRTDADTDTEDLWAGLLDVLCERAHAGFALEKLTLKNCKKVEASDVEKLRLAVPVVEWETPSDAPL